MDTTRFELPVQHGPGAATAATLNLVGYLGATQHRTAALARLETIARKYPTRLIVLDPIPEGTLSVPSSVFNVSSDARRIHVGVAAQDEHQIGYFISGTILRNIPTVLWWANEHPISQRFVEEIGHVHEVIVDSSMHVERESIFTELRAFHSTFTRTALRDLAWLRGHGWRDAIAHLFDYPVARKHLQSMRAIEISGGSSAEARYITGWLASRLGWVNERGLGFCTRDGRSVKFMHTPHNEMQEIREIRLACALANFRLVLDTNAMALTCFSQIDAQELAVQHLPFHQADDAELIEQAILMNGTDELFEASLRSLCEK